MDFPAICKYYRVFPADIAEKTLNHPVKPCKQLQCSVMKKFEHLNQNSVSVREIAGKICKYYRVFPADICSVHTV